MTQRQYRRVINGKTAGGRWGVLEDGEAGARESYDVEDGQFDIVHFWNVPTLSLETTDRSESISVGGHLHVASGVEQVLHRVDAGDRGADRVASDEHHRLRVHRVGPDRPAHGGRHFGDARRRRCERPTRWHAPMVEPLRRALCARHRDGRRPERRSPGNARSARRRLTDKVAHLVICPRGSVPWAEQRLLRACFENAVDELGWWSERGGPGRPAGVAGSSPRARNCRSDEECGNVRLGRFGPGRPAHTHRRTGRTQMTGQQRCTRTVKGRTK